MIKWASLYTCGWQTKQSPWGSSAAFNSADHEMLLQTRKIYMTVQRRGKKKKEERMKKSGCNVALSINGTAHSRCLKQWRNAHVHEYKIIRLHIMSFCFLNFMKQCRIVWYAERIISPPVCKDSWACSSMARPFRKQLPTPRGFDQLDAKAHSSECKEVVDLSHTHTHTEVLLFALQNRDLFRFSVVTHQPKTYVIRSHHWQSTRKQFWKNNVIWTQIQKVLQKQMDEWMNT